MRILLADDDIVTREILTGLLDEWGYAYEVTHNGNDALNALTRPNPPRIAILDWMMPGLSGVQVCKELQKRPSPFIYRLLLTSKCSTEDLTEALDNGAHNFLSKPFDPHVFRSHLGVAKRLIDSEDTLARVEQVAALGTFASGLAHQFNNMNTGILGYADLLASDDTLAPQQQDMALQIQKIGRRMQTITQHMLCFTDQHMRTTDTIHLETLVRDIVDALPPFDAIGPIEISFEMAETPALSGNRAALSQAILHLLTNAAHALIGRPTQEIRIRLSHNQESITLAIQDAGHGIPEEIKSKIMLPFFSTKGEHATKDAPEAHLHGLGLGLSVSDALIAQHGGAITFDSHPGEGSTFFVHLPISSPGTP